VTCLAATVYLRYHYVIDVMVALPWAAAAAALGTAWARWWEPNPDRFQGETVVSR
jgi:membrane-associated phospholipid phosphatase